MKIRRISLIKISAILFLLSIFWSASAYAQPQITGFSGSLTNGGTLTITGSGFGTKSVAAPFKWDDFENGTSGANITSNGWIPYQGGTVGHVYSGARAHTGKQSALRVTSATTDDFHSEGLKGMQTGEIYYSVWFLWNKVSGNYDQGGPVVKVLRINSTPDFYSGTTSSPSFWMTNQPTNGWTYAGMVNDSGSFTDQQDITYSAFTPAVWHRIEVAIRLSDPAGSNNGMAKVWLDGVPSYSHKTGITRTASEAGKLIDNFLLPAMIDRGGQVMEYSIDDVYVDTTQSRIEVCTSATWNGCSANDRDVEVASSWSDTAITVSVRRDAFPSGETLYLYVIDADGNVNTNGYLLSDGGDGGNTPPPSSSSGSDSGGGSGGGGGCGFVKDINGKGQGAKGEGLAFTIMLIITLAGIALAKKASKLIKA